MAEHRPHSLYQLTRTGRNRHRHDLPDHQPSKMKISKSELKKIIKAFQKLGESANIFSISRGEAYIKLEYKHAGPDSLLYLTEYPGGDYRKTHVFLPAGEEDKILSIYKNWTNE